MRKQEKIDYLRDLADWIEERGYGDKDVESLREMADDLQLAKDPIQDIAKLNEERYGLDFNSLAAYSKLLEEMKEFKEADLNNDKDEMLDALNDIIVIAIGEIRKMGYDPKCTLNEVVKEITSRKQDPDQAARWADGEKEDGEKWIKWSEQSEDELYKASFKNCIIKGD